MGLHDYVGKEVIILLNTDSRVGLEGKITKVKDGEVDIECNGIGHFNTMGYERKTYFPYTGSVVTGLVFAVFEKRKTE